MSEERKPCQKPEKLRGNPGECSPEQIKECHGDVEVHSCPPQSDEPEERKE